MKKIVRRIAALLHWAARLAKLAREALQALLDAVAVIAGLVKQVVLISVLVTAVLSKVDSEQFQHLLQLAVAS